MEADLYSPPNEKFPRSRAQGLTSIDMLSLFYIELEIAVVINRSFLICDIGENDMRTNEKALTLRQGVKLAPYTKIILE
jgi:hypothetical protein